MSTPRFRLTIWHLLMVVVAVAYGCFVLTSINARSVIGALICPAPILALIVFLLPAEGCELATGREPPEAADGAPGGG